MGWRERISVDPGILFGNACVLGTRIAVADVLGWLSAGMTAEEIVAEYPPITRYDILACLARGAEIEETKHGTRTLRIIEIR
jgi:uncharacterized protein (DUF433 family)